MKNILLVFIISSQLVYAESKLDENPDTTFTILNDQQQPTNSSDESTINGAQRAAISPDETTAHKSSSRGYFGREHFYIDGIIITSPDQPRQQIDPATGFNAGLHIPFDKYLSLQADFIFWRREIKQDNYNSDNPYTRVIGPESEDLVETHANISATPILRLNSSGTINPFVFTTIGAFSARIKDDDDRGPEVEDTYKGIGAGIEVLGNNNSFIISYKYLFYDDETPDQYGLKFLFYHRFNNRIAAHVYYMRAGLKYDYGVGEEKSIRNNWYGLGVIIGF